MNPVVYYRMDQWPETDKKGCYVLVDSAPGAHHGVACLDEAFGKPSGRGKFGGALDLHGTMGSDYAFVKNYPKTDKGQLSVSVWVWPVVLDPWAGIVSNWYHPPTERRRLGNSASESAVLWNWWRRYDSRTANKRKSANSAGRCLEVSGITWPLWPTAPFCTSTATAWRSALLPITASLANRFATV